MRIKCDYCDSVYEDTLNECPSCGAPNVKRNEGDKKPRTIEELKQWYSDRHLPPCGITRFYIGIDYRNPKAFGIYEDENGDFIVYKNKADGSRTIRYKGKDEEYAVNEIYLKLKDEIVHQKQLNARGTNSNNVRHTNQKAAGKKTFLFVVLVLIITMNIFGLIGRTIGKTNGYYNYGDSYYYKSGSDWYYYDPYINSWSSTSEPYSYSSNDVESDHYIGPDYSDAQREWDFGDEFSDVKDSSAWDDTHDYSSSSDSDYDWGGSDSWDSGGSDWDSDW